MLERVLEPEVMDTREEAVAYDEMDHAEVNRKFVDDLRDGGPVGELVLDVGTGTALIPVQLCLAEPNVRIMATDLSANMLDLAYYNIEADGVVEQIQLAQIDAKAMPMDDDTFDLVMSNSIVHHIPEPMQTLRESLRVTKPGGRLFFRDLFRPDSNEELTRLVETYVGDEEEHARNLFADSLHAALTVAEMQALVDELAKENGWQSLGKVTATSDRHWTWLATKPDDSKVANTQ